ncbi:hypothetical protein OPV22_023670 [Ensete ventricosum]|uniref:Uncharacterized protein n=1 Tax=Ensete ventricosum TaxID=4639 RepID=A0AAV8QR68_ENSVE|nr:hypothetical protein OPV22_023670 [Ensete ventricosum]
MAVTWEFVRSSDVKDGGGDQVEMGRDGFGVYDPGLPRLLQIPCHCNLTLAVTAAVCRARGTGSTTAQTPRRILALGFQRLVGSGQDARRASCVWLGAYVAFAFNARGCNKDTGNTSMYKYMSSESMHACIRQSLGDADMPPTPSHLPRIHSQSKPILLCRTLDSNPSCKCDTSIHILLSATSSPLLQPETLFSIEIQFPCFALFVFFEIFAHDMEAYDEFGGMGGHISFILYSPYRTAWLFLNDKPSSSSVVLSTFYGCRKTCMAPIVNFPAILPGVAREGVMWGWGVEEEPSDVGGPLDGKCS